MDTHLIEKILARDAAVISANFLEKIKKICDNHLNSGFAINPEVKNWKLHIFSSIRRSIAIAPVLLPLFRPIAIGNTFNNKKQFNFFNQYLEQIGVAERLTLLDENPWGKPSKYYFDVLVELNVSISSFCEGLECYIVNLCAPNYHKLRLIQAISNYVLYSISFERLPSKLIPYVVVANDHIPVNLGFLEAAKECGIPRFYVQHAFVTSDFPDLDFDVTILGNVKSATVYRTQPILEGKNLVLVVPRPPFVRSGRDYFGDSIGPVKLNTVCLYLTSNSIETNLREAIGYLISNPAIEHVYIKPHPNESCSKNIQSFLNEFSNLVIDEQPKSPHIAVVGNSSVCIDISSKGIFCYQCFSFDGFPRDYYGFVDGGLCREVKLCDLSGVFWSGSAQHFSQKSISDYFNDHSDSVVRTSCDSLRSYILNAHRKIDIYRLNKSFSLAQPKLSYSMIYPLDLATFVNEAANDEKNSQYLFHYEKIEISDFKSNHLSRIKALSYLHRCRHSKAYTMLSRAALIDKNIFVRIYAKYTYSLWANSLKSADEIKADVLIFKAIPKEEINNLVISSFSALHAYASLLLLPSEYFSNFEILLLSKYKFLSVEKLIHRILKCYSSNVVEEELFNRFNTEATDAERYRLFMLCYWNCLKSEATREIVKRFDLNVFAGASTHFDMVKQLSYFCTDEVLSELVEIYSDYEKLIAFGRMRDFRCLRFSPAERQEFISYIKSQLVYEFSFSFLRLSDGEGYIFSDCDFTHNDSLNRERHWWGYELDHASRTDIRTRVLCAVQAAHCVGVPSVFRMARELSPKISSLRESIQLRGLVTVLTGCFDFLSHNKHSCSLITEEKANQVLFSDPKALVELCKFSKQVVVISSVEKHIFEYCLQIDEIQHICIPSHFRTSVKPGYCKDNAKLPDLVQKIIDDIRLTVRPGFLVLVAAGVIGKIFVHESMLAGGVALDIGECADTYRNSFYRSRTGI